MRHRPARPRPLHRALALPLARTATLAACSDSADYHPGMHAVPPLNVRTVPATTPQPGDTLTFYALFPDSTNQRYLISWNLDARGERVASGCPRAVCAKWIVPAGRGT